MAIKHLFQGKCPRCFEGEVFKDKTWSKNYRGMHAYCNTCGLRYEYEIGFFWGAMYIGYAVNVAISVALGIATFVLGHNPDTWVYIAVIIAGVLLTSRYNFRFSRLLLLYLFAPKRKEEDLPHPAHHSPEKAKLN
jgi:uncharacterized protein (DUF983 family)